MLHIANTPRGRHAKNTTELMEIGKNRVSLKEEVLGPDDLILCNYGFYETSPTGFSKMSPETFAAAIRMVFMRFPSGRLFDFVPDVDYVEKSLALESPEVFRLPFLGRAETVADEFMRNPRMVGFKFELHNVDTDDRESSVSIHIYESTQDLSPSSFVPVNLRVIWRPNF